MRSTRFRPFALLLLGLAIALSGPACTKKRKTKVSEGTKNQILHKGNGTEPQDLDPHIVTGVPEHHLLEGLFEGLIAEHPKDLSPVPGVAAKWTISRDQRTYTFFLQKNGKWSNGDPVTAQDFVYSWNRVLSPALGSEYAYMLHYVKGAKAFNTGKTKNFDDVAVKAKDDHTLVVTLEHPTPFFLNILQHYSTWPVHKATIEKFGKMDTRGTKWTRPGNIVSNGPFKLKTWELNKIITMDRNPHYWDAKTVKLNEIHFYPIESQQTEERAFRSGDLHVTNTVPTQKIKVYKEKQPKLIRIDPYLGSYYYRFNTTKKPFNDARVRKAFALSIDRQKIVDHVTKGGQMPALNYTPPGTAGYTARVQIKPDVNKAKALLAEAGYPNGEGFPKVDILFNTLEAHRQIAEAIQQMWKKNLGVEVQLTNQEWKVYLANQKKLNYNISRAGWIGDYPDPNTFLDMFVTGGGNNQTGWSSKKYDSLIELASRTLDRNKRYEIFQKAEQILMDEQPICPIYTYTRVYLKSPHVKGWYPTIQDHHPYKHVYLSADDNVTISQN